MVSTRWLFVLTMLLTLVSTATSAEDRSPSGLDSIDLDTLVATTLERHPAARRAALHDEAARRRLDNLATRWYPSLSSRADAMYRSSVAEAPPPIDFAAPHEQVDLSVSAEQLLWDGGRIDAGRRIVEDRLALEQAELEVTLFELRRQVEETYARALLAGVELELLDTFETDLLARHELLDARQRVGVALPGDVALLDAELLDLDRRRLEAHVSRRAALDTLETLTGIELADTVILEEPQVEIPSEPVAIARAASDGEGVGRPELRVFEQRRTLLASQVERIGRDEHPRVAGSMTAGLGRPPDLDFFTDDLEPYVRIGIRLTWDPWDWRVREREQEIEQLESQVVVTEEEAFLESVSTRLLELAHTIVRLRATLEIDERIVAARARVTAQAAVQLREGVIPTADYVRERTTEHRAEVLRERHRLELVRASLAFTTTLGADR